MTSKRLIWIKRRVRLHAKPTEIGPAVKRIWKQWNLLTKNQKRSIVSMEDPDGALNWLLHKDEPKAPVQRPAPRVHKAPEKKGV